MDSDFGNCENDTVTGDRGLMWGLPRAPRKRIRSSDMHRSIHPWRSVSSLIASCVAIAVAGGVAYAATGGFVKNPIR